MVANKHIFCRSNDDFLTVKVFGEGKKSVIAFHGYGQDSEVFGQLSDVSPEWTIYSFDLFYHGLSSLPPVHPPLAPFKLQQVFEDFLRQTNIDQFIVIGFSMGGKYALSFASSFPHLIRKLILVAPDGIKKDFWYQLATRSVAVRWLFRQVVDHPEILRKTALLLDRLNIVDGRVRKFALNEMDTREKRMKVYRSWVFHRNLFVNLEVMAEKIEDKKMEVVFVLGKYDRIITPAYITPLKNLLAAPEVKVLGCGHTTLLQRFQEKFSELITV